MCGVCVRGPNGDTCLSLLCYMRERSWSFHTLNFEHNQHNLRDMKHFENIFIETREKKEYTDIQT